MSEPRPEWVDEIVDSRPKQQMFGIFEIIISTLLTGALSIQVYMFQQIQKHEVRLKLVEEKTKELPAQWFVDRVTNLEIQLDRLRENHANKSAAN